MILKSYHGEVKENQVKLLGGIIQDRYLELFRRRFYGQSNFAAIH
ncbi:MAG: hypothetical protein R2865_11455 [Deinococcales bacterium]